MRERSMLFNAPMVRAILETRKAVARGQAKSDCLSADLGVYPHLRDFYDLLFVQRRIAQTDDLTVTENDLVATRDGKTMPLGADHVCLIRDRVVVFDSHAAPLFGWPVDGAYDTDFAKGIRETAPRKPGRVSFRLRPTFGSIEQEQEVPHGG